MAGLGAPDLITGVSWGSKQFGSRGRQAGREFATWSVM